MKEKNIFNKINIPLVPLLYFIHSTTQIPCNAYNTLSILAHLPFTHTHTYHHFYALIIHPRLLHLNCRDTQTNKKKRKKNKKRIFFCFLYEN